MKTKPRPAHRILARCLSGALGQTLAQSDLPATEIEWRNVLRRSSVHLVTPALRWALREQGYTSELPTDVVEFIDAVYALNLEGNRQYEDQLAHLIRSLNSIGVRPVLLKGAAALVGGLYPTTGERMIGDIDVLVPVSSLSPVLDQLTAVGYQVRPLEEGTSLGREGFQAGGHNYAPLDSADWPVAVELHIHAVMLPFIELLTSDEIFRDATPFSWRGGECALPSPTHFILNNMIHAFLVDFKDGNALSQRQLFEFVLASQIYGARIDWNSVKTRFDAFGYRNALRQYIGFSNAYFCFNAPPGIDIDLWNKLRVKASLFRVDLSHPVAQWALAISTQLLRRARNLIKTQRNIKNLLTTSFYSRLWLSIIHAKQANT